MQIEKGAVSEENIVYNTFCSLRKSNKIFGKEAFIHIQK
jgi:hypothetical protein